MTPLDVALPARPDPHSHTQVERVARLLLQEPPAEEWSAPQRRVVATSLLWGKLTGDPRWTLLGTDGKDRPVIQAAEHLGPDAQGVRVFAVRRNGDADDVRGEVVPFA